MIYTKIYGSHPFEGTTSVSPIPTIDKLLNMYLIFEAKQRKATINLTI